MLKIIFFTLLSIFLTACTLNYDTYAPITEINPIDPIPKTGIHRVSSDETLYAIAWRYGLDFRYLAKRNHISSPYTIHTGQIIYLTRNAPSFKKIMVKTKLQPIKMIKPPVIIMKKEKEHLPVNITHWLRPANGPIISTFSSTNKGINIGGHLGDPIYAAAAGKIVYSGNALRGYGNLIIIKHNNSYLTAYAHNHRNDVKNGDDVKMGQKIAEMGKTGTQRIMLHFELRKNGQPVNPIMYLSR